MSNHSNGSNVCDPRVFGILMCCICLQSGSLIMNIQVSVNCVYNYGHMGHMMSLIVTKGLSRCRGGT